MCITQPTPLLRWFSFFPYRHRHRHRHQREETPTSSRGERRRVVASLASSFPIRRALLILVLVVFDSALTFPPLLRHCQCSMPCMVRREATRSTSGESVFLFCSFCFSCTPPFYTFLSATSLSSVRCRFPSRCPFLVSACRRPALRPRLLPSFCLPACVCVQQRLPCRFAFPVLSRVLPSQATVPALSWGESPLPFFRYAATRQKKRWRRGGHNGASAHRCFCCLCLSLFLSLPQHVFCLLVCPLEVRKSAETSLFVFS